MSNFSPVGSENVRGKHASDENILLERRVLIPLELIKLEEHHAIEQHTQSTLSFAPQTFQFDLSDLVAAGLARPRNVTVDFGNDFRVTRTGVFLQISDGTITRPPATKSP